MLAARLHAPPAPPLPRQGPSSQRCPPHICRANYRWSAEASGGRKRESLYGYDENGEARSSGNSPASGAGSAINGSAASSDMPAAEGAADSAWGPAAEAAVGGDAADAASAWQQGDWQQWPQGGGDAEAQRAAWEAAAAGIVSQRAERWRAQRAAGSGRLSRRRQQLQDEEEEEEQQQRQQAAAEMEQAAVAAAAAAVAGAAVEQPLAEPAAPQPVAADRDPWMEAEMRQLRRRQRAAASRRGGGGSAAAAGANGTSVPAAAAAAGGAALPDPWAAEWGPAAAAPPAAAAAAEDYGWGAESWAQDGVLGGGRRQRQQQAWQPEEEAEAQAGAGPGSAWDFAQQQQQLRRRRRRRQADSEDEDDAYAAAAAAAAGWGAAAAAGAGAGAGGSPYGDAGGGYGAAPADGRSSYYAGAGPQQQQQQQQGWGYEPGGRPFDQEYPPGWEDGEGEDDDEDEMRWQYSDEYEPGLTAEPDIALLSTDELDRALPVVPFSQQAAYFSGSATDGLQRWGASLAMTVLLSKVAVLATTSLTWPLWWPWALAAKKNLSVRRQYRYGGLWRTQVLGVTITGRPKPFSSVDGGGLLGASTVRLARVLVGDPGGAQTELALPYDARYERIQPGEPAELVVLSADPSFQQFKAVKDVYLPNCGLWVSEYPHLDRTQFLEVSLQVEREAQEAAEAAQRQQEQQQVPYGEQQYSGAYGPASSTGWQPDGYSPEQRY